MAGRVGGRVSAGIGKTDAVRLLADAAGIAGIDEHDYTTVEASIARIAAALGDTSEFVFEDAAALRGVAERVVVPARHRDTRLPRFTNGRPDSFPPHQGSEASPALRLLTVLGGHFLHLGRAPVTVLPDRRTVVRDYSSHFAGLAAFYDVDVPGLLERAVHVPGAALVLSDDIFPLNFSHWILDTLPRLACIGERRDVTIVVSDARAEFKRDSLRLCGIHDERVLYLPDFAGVRADTLLVPRDTRDMPHPAHKAAAWAMDFLRARVGLPAVLAASERGPRKLYVSRADAAGRRVLNEAALLRLLLPRGYLCATLSGRSLAEQVALFAGATHVVGLHGAGLTGMAFAPHGSRLVEIFPASYGTAAYYVITAGQDLDYASYVARDVRAGARTQVDDVVIDVADFERCCGALL